MFKIIRLSFFLCFLTCFSFSAFSQARKYSNEFLAIGVGARALGMSNSQVASVNDVSSGYWNPAGLLGVKGNFQIGLMHSEYFAGIAKYDYGAYAKPLDSTSAMGISIVRFAVDDIPNTTELIDANGNVDYNRIKSFSAADYGFIFSYAKNPGIEGLTLGGNAKVIHRKVGEFATAWGFGLDAGAQYKYEKWMFGATARDVTSTFNAWKYTLSERVKEVFILTGNEIPQNSLEITLPKLILGAARTYQYKKISALVETNFDLTFDGMRNTFIKSKHLSMDPHFGLELGYNGFIFLRGGLGNFQKTTDIKGADINTLQPNMGVGVKIKSLTVDYALTNINQQVGLLSNVFSLKFDINRAEN